MRFLFLLVFLYFFHIPSFSLSNNKKTVKLKIMAVSKCKIYEVKFSSPEFPNSCRILSGTI